MWVGPKGNHLCACKRKTEGDFTHRGEGDVRCSRERSEDAILEGWVAAVTTQGILVAVGS